MRSRHTFSPNINDDFMAEHNAMRSLLQKVQDDMYTVEAYYQHYMKAGILMS